MGKYLILGGFFVVGFSEFFWGGDNGGSEEAVM